MNEGAGGDEAAQPLFYVIGNCAKNRVASTGSFILVSGSQAGADTACFFEGEIDHQ